MGNHEYCIDCGRNDYHNYSPCNPIDVAEHLDITIKQAKKKRQCQPLDKQPSYIEPKECNELEELRAWAIDAQRSLDEYEADNKKEIERLRRKLNENSID